MRATWYVLEDGTAVDPSEVSRNETGALAHPNGLVAMRSPDCPRSRGVDVGTDGKLLFAGWGGHDGIGAAGGAGAEPVVAAAPVAEAAGASAPPAPEPIKTADMTAAPAPAPVKNPGYQTRSNRRGR